ncbi:MAG: translation initiation factor Sui1 [Acidobacteria bacterium]|nr:MAG: translation initiation factor Sui1 [Acidobacteriota bacterium]
MGRSVYSTGVGRLCPTCGQPALRCTCKQVPPPSTGDGIVRVGLESRGRHGKTVTIISGVPLAGEALRRMARELKRHCGAGGAVKAGVIEIQGDHRDRVLAELQQAGFHVQRVGGH